MHGRHDVSADSRSICRAARIGRIPSQFNAFTISIRERPYAKHSSGVATSRRGNPGAAGGAEA